MKSDTNALRVRLWAHPFDHPDAPRPFSRKLAEQNGWRHDYALRVIEEYRRFVYLAVVSGQVVTPSDTVDQAWHLHLTCTRDYWTVFCPTVLGRPLHHDPGNGSAADAHRHAAQYAATLVAYRQHFGAEAPVDIWPRAATGAEFVRVDRRRRWLVPRLPRLPRIARRTTLPLSMGLASLLLASCVMRPEGDAGFNVFNFDGPHFLVFYVLAILCYGLLYLATRYGPRLLDFTGRDQPNSRLLPEQLAYLQGGPDRAVEVGILRLCKSGHIKVDGSHQILDVAPGGGDTLLESAILNRVRRTQRLHEASDQHELAAIEQLRDELVRATLLRSPRLLQTFDYVLGKLALLLFTVGAIKLVIGIARGAPVTWLLVLLGGLYACTAASWRARPPLREPTRLGEQTLRHWKHAVTRNSTQDRLLYRFALLGANALIGTPWARLYPILMLPYAAISTPSNKRASGTSDCSNGSSCGGGGCGGCGGGD